MARQVCEWAHSHKRGYASGLVTLNVIVGHSNWVKGTVAGSNYMNGCTSDSINDNYIGTNNDSNDGDLDL